MSHSTAAIESRTVSRCAALLFWLGPAVVLATSGVAQAATVTFHSSEASWLAAVNTPESFAFTAPNVALANEVGAAPVSDQSVSATLTFATANTGLARGFQLRALESGADFVFEDDPSALLDDSLSPGRINLHEDDDWDVTLLTGPAITAFAFQLIDNDGGGGETLSVFGSGGLLGALSPTPAQAGVSLFVGIVSDEAITRIAFDEAATNDDIALGTFQFATAVPEPSSGTLLALGVLAMAVRRRRRR